LSVTIRPLIAAMSLTLSSAALPAAEPFPDGARVVLFGDSITHNGFYGTYIAHFYETRFPDRKVEFINAGTSGGNTTDGFDRIEWDVLSHNPTDVVINFGMNDVGTSQYTGPEPARTRTTDGMVSRFEERMTEILDRLKGAGIKRIILTIPTPYDQTGNHERESAVGKNDAIIRCGEALKRFAAERQLPLVDFNSTLLALNAKYQPADPSFTTISPDRVHPGKPGHLVMTSEFLKAQGLATSVWEARIDLAKQGDATAETTRAKISAIQQSADSVTWTMELEAIPFAVDAEPEASTKPSALPALEWIPFESQFNREILRIDGLSAGRWELRMNDRDVGTYSADALAMGIDLRRAEGTPQKELSLKMLNLALDRREEERKLRAESWIRTRVLEPAGVDVTDFAACDAAIAEWRKADDFQDGWNRYAEQYVEFRSAESIAKVQARIDALKAQIRAEAQLAPVACILRRVT